MATDPISKPIRVVLAVVAVPSLILAAMLGWLIVSGRQNEIGFYEALYAVMGVAALYTAVKGHLPFRS